MKTERKGYQKAVLVIAVFTILAGALYATDNFRKIPQNKSGSGMNTDRGRKIKSWSQKQKIRKRKSLWKYKNSRIHRKNCKEYLTQQGKSWKRLYLGKIRVWMK